MPDNKPLHPEPPKLNQELPKEEKIKEQVLKDQYKAEELKEKALAEQIKDNKVRDEMIQKKVAEDREARRTEKENALSRLQIILAQYGGLECNIPYPHEYWALNNQYRGL